MRNPAAVVIGIGALLAVTSAASAQDQGAPERTPSAAEITPHVSLGSAGASGFGAAVRWPFGANLSVELEMSLRNAELNALGSNLSLLFDLPALGVVTPYVVAGVGLEQYGYATGSPGTPVIARTTTALTVNAGGGVRVAVGDTWGVRGDMRWFNGIGREAPERWRLYNGVTFSRGGQ
jgi:hypothetical protein